MSQKFLVSEDVVADFVRMLNDSYKAHGRDDPSIQRKPGKPSVESCFADEMIQMLFVWFVAGIRYEEYSQPVVKKTSKKKIPKPINKPMKKELKTKPVVKASSVKTESKKSLFEIFAGLFKSKKSPAPWFATDSDPRLADVANPAPAKQKRGRGRPKKVAK